MRLASVIMMANDMSCDPTFEICSPLISARFRMPGTPATMVSMPTAPDV